MIVFTIFIKLIDHFFTIFIKLIDQCDHFTNRNSFYRIYTIYVPTFNLYWTATSKDGAIIKIQLQHENHFIKNNISYSYFQ